MHVPRFSCTALFAAALLLLSANADASYKAWYIDDTDGFYQYGDLVAGSTKLSIPNSACARRWTLPKYYRWVGQYSNTISSADLYSTVEIWVPKPGCPNGNTLVFQKQSGQVYSPPSGTHYLELYSDYGSNWIDADGKHLSCLPGCVGLGGWGYKANNHSWGVVELLLEDIKQALPGGDTRRADALLAEVQQRMPELVKQLDARVQERRRTPLDGFERYISDIEDAAGRNLQVSAKRLLDCRGDLATGSRDGAYAGCGQALDALRNAGDLLDLAESEWSDL